jgi:hypothetical protein
MKELFAAKGIYSSWDFLGSVSAAIVPIQHCKKSVSKIMEVSYKNKDSTPPDLTPQVYQVVRQVKEHSLLDRIPNRKLDVTCQPVPDLLREGHTKVVGSLGTFNKRLKLVADGMDGTIETLEAEELSEMQLEVEELSEMQWGEEDDEDEQNGVNRTMDDIQEAET